MRLPVNLSSRCEFVQVLLSGTAWHEIKVEISQYHWQGLVQLGHSERRNGSEHAPTLTENDSRNVAAKTHAVACSEREHGRFHALELLFVVGKPALRPILARILPKDALIGIDDDWSHADERAGCKERIGNVQA